MIWIQTAALCLWLLNLVLLLSGSVWAWWWVRKAPPVDLIDQPPVSILKPLKGVDPGLESSLESFLNLEYPKYEVIFSIADARDPAVKVVTELLSRYPNAPARLIIGEEIVGANPKVNNLIRPLDMASYDQILISDSYIRASPDYIQHLLQPSRPNVGVVTGLRRGREGQGLGGRLEELHINCFYIRWQLLAQLFRMDFVIGSSMLFRKSFADKFGGLRALADHGSEDYAFGLATKRHGKKVGMTRTPVTQYIGEKSLSEFWQRHRRWSALRKYAAPGVFYIEWQHSMFIVAALGGIGLAKFGPGCSLFAALATALLWMLCDMSVLKAIEGAKLDPVLWLLKEFLLPLNWLHAAFSRHINWRGNKLKIQSGGWVQAIDAHEAANQSWVPVTDP